MSWRRAFGFMWRDAMLSKGAVAFNLSVCAGVLWERSDGKTALDQALAAWTFISMSLVLFGLVAIVRQQFRHRTIRKAFEAERAACHHALAEGDLQLAKRHLDIIQRFPDAYSASEALEPGPESCFPASDPRSRGEKAPREGSGP